MMLFWLYAELYLLWEVLGLLGLRYLLLVALVWFIISSIWRQNEQT